MTERKVNTEQMTYKPLKDMNLTDDFLFDAATEDIENCKIIIELSMGIHLKSLKWREGQKVIHNLPGKRGIRMDFCAEDDEGQIFDVEMQKSKVGNIPKRTRFYQALWDAPILKSGEKGFDNLRPMYIIIICEFDLFDGKKYRYTFDNRCKEAPDLIMGDECTKIILNTRGENDHEVEKSLVDFLHYVSDSQESTLNDMCDERLRDLHQRVKEIKLSEQMEVAYMKMEERDRLIREEGERLGEIKGEQRGEELFATLTQQLLADQRIEDLKRATEDPDYRNELYIQYDLMKS